MIQKFNQSVCIWETIGHQIKFFFEINPRMSSDLQETYLNCIQSEDKLWDNFSPFYEGATKE